MTAIHRALEHRARAFVALLLVALAAVSFAACGSDDKGGSGDSADAKTLLRETFSGTKDVRSGKVAVKLSYDQGGDAIALDVDGPFQSNGTDTFPSFDMSVDARLGGQGSLDAGLVSTDDKLYVELSGSAYEIPSSILDQARDSVRRSERKRDAQPLSAFGIDPESWVEDPQIAGDEQVGGVDTTHITAKLDVNAFLDDVDDALAAAGRQGLSSASGQQIPDRLPADVRSDIENAIRDPKVDIWTGKDDKTLRKLELDLGLTVRGRAGDLSFSVELQDLNQPQAIEAPQDVRPISELLQGLSGLLGGGALGGSSGSGGTPQGFDDYQQCLTRAGRDLAKAQRCAALLGR